MIMSSKMFLLATAVIAVAGRATAASVQSVLPMAPKNQPNWISKSVSASAPKLFTL